MAKITIAEAFDFPFRRIGQKNDGEAYYAAGALRIEPLATEAVEYTVDLPEEALAPPVQPSFFEAVGAGVQECAQDNEMVGLRVTLTAIEAHETDSSDRWFHGAAYSALEDALKAHGVFADPVTIAEAFDQPFRYVTSERYAAGTLRLEPIAGDALDYAVSLSDETLPNWCRAYAGSVEAGVRQAARKIGLIGVRVTLTQLLWHDVNSSAWCYEAAANRAVSLAAEAHGVPRRLRQPGSPLQKRQDLF